MEVIDTELLRARLGTPQRPQLVLQRRIDDPAIGHLPGSLILDRGDLDVALRALEPTEPIVVYGARPRCAESRLLAIAFETNGFSQVAWYVGGLITWRAAGLPVEGATAPTDGSVAGEPQGRRRTWPSRRAARQVRDGREP